MKDLQTITADLGRSANVEAMHMLLRHLVLVRFDALHEGAAEDPATIALAEQALAPGQAGQTLLRILDVLVDQWDRRNAALQISPAFRDLRVIAAGDQQSV